MNDKYPKVEDIKVEWTLIQKLIILIITLIIIGFLIYESRTKCISLTKYLSVGGLYIDIIGVVIASLKTPYYGSFYDGGQIEIERAKVEKKYFQRGMSLIALGMILQTISTLLQ